MYTDIIDKWTLTTSNVNANINAIKSLIKA